MRVLEGLDQVDWAALWHAHGSAEDVPAMLMALELPGTCEEACADLFETVWHQGTIYPASPPVLPFLFQIIESSSHQAMEHSPDLLAAGLVAAIVTGEGWVQKRVKSMGEEGARAQMQRLGRRFDEERELESKALQSIRQTVALHRSKLERHRRQGEGLGEAIEEALNSLEKDP